MKQFFKYLDNNLWNDENNQRGIFLTREENEQLSILDLPLYFEEKGYSYKNDLAFSEEYKFYEESQQRLIAGTLLTILEVTNPELFRPLYNHVSKNYNVHISDTYMIEKLEKIGEGWSAIVYEVNEMVVEKRLKSTFQNEPMAQERLKEEFDMMVKMQNSSKIITAIEMKNDFSFTMEKARSNLHEYISNKLEFLTEDDKIKIFTQICDGIVELHENKIIHRDLHLQNIFVMSDDLEIKIGDLGFSKDAATKTLYTISGEMMNHEYIAPEAKINVRLSDEKSDIYSLGKILEKLFWDSSKYSEVIKNATRTNPQERYPNATELKKRLLQLYQIRPLDEMSLVDLYNSDKSIFYNQAKTCPKRMIEIFISDIIDGETDTILNEIVGEYIQYINSWTDYDNFGYMFYSYLIKTEIENKIVFDALIRNPGNRFYIEDLIKKIPYEISYKYN